MADNLKQYLQTTIAPRFLSLISDGEIYYNLDQSKKYVNEERTTVQLSRYLWFYSAYYQTFKDEKILSVCDDLYKNLVCNYKTEENGYIISNLSDDYHVYSQSFALYGLSEYYKLNHCPKVLDEIKSLHDFIENHFYKSDTEIYQEQIDNALQATDKNVIDSRLGGFTANSLIHLLEAYTNLANVTTNYKEILQRLLDILFDRFYDEEGYFIPYVTKKGKKDKSYVSYGHDIETVWLVIEALKTLGISVDIYSERLTKVYQKVAEEGLRRDGYIKIQSNREHSCWWGQAEAIVGFAYCKKYLQVDNDFSKNVYEFTNRHYITEQGLLNEIDNEGNVVKNEIANCWKTPYHEGRMMLKMLDYFEKGIIRSDYEV